MEDVKCKCCSGTGRIETGKHIGDNSLIKFVPDGNTKECFSCDGTGIPRRLDNK